MARRREPLRSGVPTDAPTEEGATSPHEHAPTSSDVVSEAVDNQKAFEGRLRGVARDAGDETVVLLEGPKARMHRLPLRLITRGRLEVEF